MPHCPPVYPFFLIFHDVGVYVCVHAHMWEGAKLCSHYAPFPRVVPAFLPAARAALRASNIYAHSVNYAASPQKPKEEVTIGGGHLSLPAGICRNGPAGQTSFCVEGDQQIIFAMYWLESSAF